MIFLSITSDEYLFVFANKLVAYAECSCGVYLRVNRPILVLSHFYSLVRVKLTSPFKGGHGWLVNFHVFEMYPYFTLIMILNSIR